MIRYPHHVASLRSLPLDLQQEIAEAVAQAKPPEKWLDLRYARIESRAWFEWHWQRGIFPEEQE